MKDKLRNKGQHHLRYNLKKWVRSSNFDILNVINDFFTLVQLMDTTGNVNHTISIVGYWIFDSNKKNFI